MKNLNKIKKPLRDLRDKFFDKRERLARKWLNGTGLEIGALHKPLKVSETVTVLYVDRVTRERSIEKFPELPAMDIVPVAIIDDGFDLEHEDLKGKYIATKNFGSPVIPGNPTST